MVVIGIDRDPALRSLELDAAGRRNDLFRIVGAGAFECGREEIDLTVGALRIEAAERPLAETGEKRLAKAQAGLARDAAEIGRGGEMAGAAIRADIAGFGFGKREAAYRDRARIQPRLAVNAIKDCVPRPIIVDTTAAGRSRLMRSMTRRMAISSGCTGT